jgi:hypothetical protein
LNQNTAGMDSFVGKIPFLEVSFLGKVFLFFLFVCLTEAVANENDKIKYQKTSTEKETII